MLFRTSKNHLVLFLSVPVSRVLACPFLKDLDWEWSHRSSYYDIERLTHDYGIMISQVLGERRRRKQVVHFEGILSDHGAATKIHAYFQDRHIYSGL